MKKYLVIFLPKKKKIHRPSIHICNFWYTLATQKCCFTQLKKHNVKLYFGEM